jgi:hypothetical protein
VQHIRHQDVGWQRHGVNSDGWTVLTQPATDLLLQQLSKFCEKGGIFLLLQQLKAAGVADPGVVKLTESSAFLINLVRWLTPHFRVGRGQFHPRPAYSIVCPTSMHHHLF